MVAALLVREADDLAVTPRPMARRAVRRRLSRLRRRRQLKTTLGSSTLAASLFASAGLHELRIGRSSGGPVAAAEPLPTRPTLPATTTPPSTAPSPPGVPSSTTTSTVPGPGFAASWSGDLVAADPGVLYAEGRYHVYTTSALPYSVPRFAGRDLGHPGALMGDAMPERPAWVDPQDRVIWAPQVQRIGGRYVMYFAATGPDGLKCLGAAVASTPDGPFAPEAQPLHCSDHYWAIDPYPVQDGDQWYLLWRQDDHEHTTGKIVVAPLSADGLRLVGDGHTLLTGTQDWERGYGDGGIGPIENPAMVRHPDTGEWLLTWSANRWETESYATGLARCAGPLGPCERISSAEPWLRTGRDPAITTSARFGGAGGMSFVVGPDGRLYAVFHAYRGAGRDPDPRLTWAYRVDAEPGTGGYRLVEISGNQTGNVPVNGT